jgi:hypothetical protein
MSNYFGAMARDCREIFIFYEADLYKVLHYQVITNKSVAPCNAQRFLVSQSLELMNCAIWVSQPDYEALLRAQYELSFTEQVRIRI